MKNQQGFIQIPIIIAIIVGVLILGGAGYFGVKQYQNYQVAKTEKEKTAKEIQAITEAQQKALDKTKSEVEALKRQVAKSDEKQKSLEQQVQIQKPSTEIVAQDLNPYLYGIVKIDCGNSSGSATLWKIDGDYFALTNRHVVDGTTYKGGYCFVFAFNTFGNLGIYYIYPYQSRQWNSDTDVALLPIYDTTGEDSDRTKLSYNISMLQKCASTMHTGSSLVVIGYPAYAQQGVATQITTNGIISGFGPVATSLPDPNYFISAKIDSGNSGGIAFAKNENGLCILGIPTWLTVGNYETQGVVQNIHNVMYAR